ncbi:MAG: hypothetical protein ACI90V_004419 [Bacillariaceae sp.]|jgi:hypothetical protein
MDFSRISDILLLEFVYSNIIITGYIWICIEEKKRKRLFSTVQTVVDFLCCFLKYYYISLAFYSDFSSVTSCDLFREIFPCSLLFSISFHIDQRTLYIFLFLLSHFYWVFPFSH